MVRYSVYIESAAWRAKREKLFAARGKKCEYCKSTKNIQVHHLTYKRLGREWLQDLQVLCVTCHKAIHEANLAVSTAKPKKGKSKKKSFVSGTIRENNMKIYLAERFRKMGY